MSDPSHLEIIDEVQSTVAPAPRENDGSDLRFLRTKQELREEDQAPVSSVLLAKQA